VLNGLNTGLNDGGIGQTMMQRRVVVPVVGGTHLAEDRRRIQCRVVRVGPFLGGPHGAARNLHRKGEHNR
jgi:hypothetical protein